MTPQGFPTPKDTSQALVYSALDCGGGTALSSDFEYRTALGDSTLQLPHPIPFHRGIFACVYATPGTYAMRAAVSFIEGSADSYQTLATASAEASVFVAVSPGTGTATAIPRGATQFEIPNPAQPNGPGAYTWTAPAGVTKVHVWAWGGGGAGYKVYGGGGGGFGGADVPVTPGASYDVKVGGGGDPTYWMWSRGGDSAFGSFVTARGGNAGAMTIQNIHYSDQDAAYGGAELFTPGTGGGATFGRGTVNGRGFQGEQGTRQDVACPGAEFSMCHGPVGTGGQGGGKGGAGGTGANRNGSAPGGGGGFANAYFAGGGNPEGTGGYGGGGKVIIAPVTEVSKNTPPAGKPDLTASTPTVQWVGGPTTGKEAQNIFAAGATVRVSAYIQNQGTAAAGTTQSGWRAAEAPVPDSVAQFGDAPPLVETHALEAGKRALLMREIADIRTGSFGMGLCADEGNSAAESEEGNNCSPQAVRFMVVTPSIATVTPTTPTPQAPPPAPPPVTQTPDFCAQNPSLCYRWDGWIKLSGTATNGSPYGVRYDPKTTRFCGFAWGGEVVGWIEFGPIMGNGCDQSATHYQWARLADTVPKPDANKKLFMIIVPGFSSDPKRPDSNPDTLPDDIQYDGTRWSESPYALSGWAWSSNIGWISMTSDNMLKDGGARYHVSMEVKGDKDKTSGRSLKGYAWSPNIGWVK